MKMPDDMIIKPSRRRRSVAGTPLVSVVVVAFDIPRELPRTLESLAPSYQRDIQADEYEVIVLERYQDVRRSGMEPLEHYLQFGAREGRDPGPGIDGRGYLSQDPDEARGGPGPLIDFLEHSGRTDGAGGPPSA